MAPAANLEGAKRAVTRVDLTKTMGVAQTRKTTRNLTCSGGQTCDGVVQGCGKCQCENVNMGCDLD